MPEKRKFDPKKCQEEVYNKDSIIHPFRQCQRAGVVEEEGKLWCRQHAPSARRRRRTAQEEAYEAKQREHRKEIERVAWERVIRKVEREDKPLAAQLRLFARRHDILD